ncbi:MAG: hypothetical protein ABUS47_06620 [Steroidobacter sp.]
MKPSRAINDRKRAHADQQRRAFIAAISASRLNDEQRDRVRKLIAMQPHLSDEAIAKIIGIDASAVAHVRRSS